MQFVSSLSASACLWQCLALRHGGCKIPDSYAVVKHQPLNWPGLSGTAICQFFPGQLAFCKKAVVGVSSEKNILNSSVECSGVE